MNYKVLIDTIYDGFYFTDSDRRIMFWNKSAERITGFIAEEVLGHRCSDNILIHVDGKGNNLCLGMCPLAATIEDGSSRESEVYLHHKNGHRLPVWIRITPIRDTKGVIVGGAELFTDLSPRNALALRIEELERHALLDNLTQLANRYYETFDKMTSFSKGIFSTIFSAGYHISPVTLDMVTEYDDESEL